jgi:hypothetical protein
MQEAVAATARLAGPLDGGRLRPRGAQHRQHGRHRRELRLRPLAIPAAQRPRLHRRLFRHNGLYSFGRQPEAAFWNLQQLAGCLTMVTDQSRLVEALNGFRPAYRANWRGDVAALGAENRGRGGRRGPGQRRLPGAGGRRRRPALGAVLLRLVRRPRLGGPRHGRPRAASTAARPSSTSAVADWRVYEPRTGTRTPGRRSRHPGRRFAKLDPSPRSC